MLPGAFFIGEIMNELIKIERKVIGDEEVNSVDARELYDFLGVKMHFTDWILPKIKDYGFVINSDFCRSTCISINGREMENYILSIDMAKELAMLSKTQKGKEARQYFIDCEKKLKQIIGQTAKMPEIVQCQLMGAETVARMLNYSEASKLEIVENVYKSNNIPSGFLPSYIPNAKIVLSATELLKRNNCNIGIKAFNSLLVSNGYLEDRERPSNKKYVVKKFKALTDKGLTYGQNDVSPRNKLEVQPHYFEDSFMELYNIVTA